MRGQSFFVISCFLAALAPFAPWDVSTPAPNSSVPQWPTEFDGHGLKQSPLSDSEQRFALGFPGAIAKFTAGDRAIILRWITARTRKLHPAADCFKGAGWVVTPLPAEMDSTGRAWGRFTARRGNESVRVSERIHDENGHEWTDVSAWHWAALFRGTRAPWWNTTVVEKISLP